MTKIVFPMAVPGTISIAIYGFVWSWNDLLYSMTLVTDSAQRTLASGLVMTFLGEASTNWGYMMAASIVSAIPVTIIFVFLQRYFISGPDCRRGEGINTKWCPCKSGKRLLFAYSAFAGVFHIHIRCKRCFEGRLQ